MYLPEKLSFLNDLDTGNGKLLLQAATIAKINLIVQWWKSPVSVRADYFEAVGNLAA